MSLALFASQILLVLIVWDASTVSVTLSVLLVMFFAGLLFPLESRGAELGGASSASTTSAVLRVGDWPPSLTGSMGTHSVCMTAEWVWPGSQREGVEAWLVSVSSVSWAEEGEELQGDDGQQESQEQLV